MRFVDNSMGLGCHVTNKTRFSLAMGRIAAGDSLVMERVRSFSEECRPAVTNP
jgi:hypothetical protein